MPVNSDSDARAGETTVQDDDEINLLDLLQVVVDNLRLLVLAPLAIGLLALGISFLIPPTFTAKTEFLPPQQQQSGAAAMLQSLGALGGLAGAATGLKNPNDQFVAFLESTTVQDALIARFKLVEYFKAEFKTDARRSLAGISTITSGKDGLIAVEVSDKDPVFAAKLANGYVEELSRLLDRLAVTEAQQRRVFFEAQLQKAKEALVKAEQALGASGVNAATLKSRPEVAVAAVAQLQAQIAAQEIKLASMRGYLADSAPDFRQAQTELAALRNQLAKSEKTSTATPSGGDADYVARYRDFVYQQTLFELFAKQYEIARIDESREGAVIQVVDAAEPPERKSKPKKALIAALAALGSGLFLLFFVFVRQAVRNADQLPETAEKLKHLRTSFRRSMGRRGS